MIRAHIVLRHIDVDLVSNKMHHMIGMADKPMNMAGTSHIERHGYQSILLVRPSLPRVTTATMRGNGKDPGCLAPRYCLG